MVQNYSPAAEQESMAIRPWAKLPLLRAAGGKTDNRPVSRSRWQQRIARAEDLARKHSFAAEILRFYVQIARFQEGLYLSQPERHANFPQFLDLVANCGPERVAHSATGLRRGAEKDRIDLLDRIWPSADDSPSTPEDFLAFAYLQPFAEFGRESSGVQVEGYAGSDCPWCNRRPGLAVLRPQGDGGQRNLVCGFCLAEWQFRRVVCPGCGEENHIKLPVYTAAELPHIRVECCDSCKTYIKCIDLTKTGLADPLVDELASIPLDLWAEGHCYAKLHPNLLGM